MVYLRHPQSTPTQLHEHSNYTYIGRRHLYTGSNTPTDDDFAEANLGIIIPAIAGAIMVAVVFLVFRWFVTSICDASQEAPQDRESHEQERPDESNTNSNVWNFGLSFEVSSVSVSSISQSHGAPTSVSNHIINMETIRAQLDRKHLVRSKLHYQIVLADKSNVNIDSLRGDVAEEDDTTKTSNDDDADDCSTIASDHDKRASVTTESISSLYHRVQDLFSLRSVRPRQEDVCSICLEGYCPGQTICAAKNACCNHMFHEACIGSWLMEQDYCPLCRRDVME
mmetsp:Transcript_22689/g.56079  ORF Transcript_22689/g.56079 Transcript_22689/m.56079 type:complete len:282 (+) Transcript_22689:67-912(+)